MNWRTDKPTADVIVAYTRFENIPPAVFRKLEDGYYKGSARYDAEDITKWADLEEDETVTDCHQLEEELDAFIKSGKAIKEENCGTYTTTYIDPLKVARHFARWGAEHLIDANKMIGDHITDGSKKKSGDSINSNDLEEAAVEWCKKNHKGIALSGDKKSHYLADGLDAFIAGANWQSEQFHDACYQCEKDYDIVFYKVVQHAFETMKEEATEVTVYEDAGGYPFVPAIEMYDYEKDEPTAKKGDKVWVYIFRDNKE